ncbi:MAG: hypothetical protein IT337_03325 [Thermomicrobiales bacterium]|nr:hypothetical protein [Thermomicrobiales bacterium]
MGDDESGGPSGGTGSGLIYCGLCGALNPSTSYYCAACGATLVDAFHATEGVRVFERPDPAARIIDILPAGSDLDLVPDAAAPADYLRVRLPYGRLGYVRTADAAAGIAPPPTPLPTPDINTHARGCVSTTAALAALALLVIMAVFGLVIVLRARPADAGILWLIYCLTIVPLLLLTIGLYVGARNREDRLEEEAELATFARRPHDDEIDPPH